MKAGFVKILITGITGLIGKELALALLKEGHNVYGVSRKSRIEFLSPQNSIQLDLEKEIPESLLKDFDVIIHLAGYPVADRRWTGAVKEKIRTSRVLATSHLVKAINKLPEESKPKYFVSGSAIGIYGKGFLAEVTTDWESQARRLNQVPFSILRTGIVLCKKGGALSKMRPVVVGDGGMIMSWIHISDWVSACQYLIEQKLTGEYNFVAPHPVPQKEFVKTMIQVKKQAFSLWAPRGLLNIALGERANVLFESLDVKPIQLINKKYQFKFSFLQDALKDIYMD